MSARKSTNHEDVCGHLNLHYKFGPNDPRRFTPRPPRERRAWEHEERQLRYASSETRAQDIVNVWNKKHPYRVQLLGMEWSGCDGFPPDMLDVLRELPCPALDAMIDAERAYLDALPEKVEVWRGCYEHNAGGFSWTTDPEVARRFPYTNRYWHPQRQPLLLRGQVPRDRILFVKLDETEVVSLDVRVVERIELPKAESWAEQKALLAQTEPHA